MNKEQKDASTSKKTIAQLSIAIQTKEQQLVAKTEDIKQLKAQLDHKDAMLVQVQHKLATATEELADKGAQINALQNEREAHQATEASLRISLANAQWALSGNDAAQAQHQVAQLQLQLAAMRGERDQARAALALAQQ